MDRLDLHGVRHEDAKNKVEEYILLHEPPFTIITGNSIRMQEIVVEVMGKYGFKCIEFNTCIIAG